MRVPNARLLRPMQLVKVKTTPGQTAMPELMKTTLTLRACLMQKTPQILLCILEELQTEIRRVLRVPIPIIHQTPRCVNHNKQGNSEDTGNSCSVSIIALHGFTGL